MIELEDVSKTYHADGIAVQALRDIDLRVDEGEFVALHVNIRIVCHILSYSLLYSETERTAYPI